MTPAEKRAYRVAEKKAAAEIAECAQRLVDARDYAAVYMARVRLGQAIRGLNELALSLLDRHEAARS